MSGLLRRLLGGGTDEEREYGIRLVFALGNPGAEYARNRRNVGFWVVNKLAKKRGAEFDRKTGTYALAEAEIGGRRIAIAKTRTYNNESGSAVMALIRTLKLDDAREMIEFFTKMSDVPFVVAANKVTADDAEALRNLRNHLSLPPGTPLLPVDAKNRDSVKAALLGLLYEILKSME